MPPSIPGLGSQGGFSLWLQDRSGGSIEFLNEQPAEVPGGGAPAAGAGRRDVAVHGGRAADLRRRRSRQGAASGRRARRRLSDDADVSRRVVRESVQPLRPAVARVPAGGRRGSHVARADRAVLRAQRRRHDGAAVGAAVDVADVRAAVHEPVQRLPRGADHRRGGAGLQLGAGDGGARGSGASDAAARDRLRLVGSVVSGATGVGHDRA